MTCFCDKSRNPYCCSLCRASVAPMAPKPKAVRKGTLKRPASKLSPKSHDARVDVATLSAEKFSLTDFIRATWNLNGLAPSSTCKRALTVSICCTGVNSFGYVLKKMVHCLGQQVKLKDLFGSECDKACQAFLLRNNRAPRCLFEAPWPKRSQKEHVHQVCGLC